MNALQQLEDDVKGVFRDILEREIGSDSSPHGSFVMAFARAVLKADDDNFLILLPVALQLIHKYRLGEGVVATAPR